MLSALLSEIASGLVEKIELKFAGRVFDSNAEWTCLKNVILLIEFPIEFSY